VLGLSAATGLAGEEWSQNVGTLTIKRTSTVGFGVTTETSEAIHFQVMTSNASVTHANSCLPGFHIGSASLVDVNWPQLMKKQKCQQLKKQLCQQKTMLTIDVNWQDYLIDTVGRMQELIVVPTKEDGVVALET